MALTGSTNAEKIWNYCKNKGMNAYGCAGVLGNLDCESGLNPKNMQDSYEIALGYTDETYTAAVDSGRYGNFVKDGSGFGICQWTYWTRKLNLYNFAMARGCSIGDLEMQLDFFYKELSESFRSVLNTLKTATSVLQASNAMLLQFECPLNSGADVQALRASYSQTYYNRFATQTAAQTTEVKKSMGYITVKKKAGQQVSEHFNSTEFDCHGGGCCSETIINEKLVEYLEKIREHFGKPITITSAYRCVVHNGSVGGATGSRHTKGDAADIVVSGITPREVAQYAESIGIKGIGLYETSSDGHFVHIDTRDVKSFWYGQACAARTTFGGTASSTTTTSIASGTSSGSSLLNLGSSGSAVKALQENLVKLGYSLSADGAFGNITRNAVRDFQQKHNLTVDGIVGSQTLNAITSAVSAATSSATTNTTSSDSFAVKVNATLLNVRSGAGTNYPIVGTIRDKGIYTIVAESTGQGASKWGKLSTNQGWIALDYCIKS